MACFLWTAPDRVAQGAQGADRSKRGRAWAREAASLQEEDPVKLELEMRVFKLAWESKRQRRTRGGCERSGPKANGGLNRRRRTRRGTGAKAQASEGTEEGTGNLVTPGVGNDPGGVANRF